MHAWLRSWNTLPDQDELVLVALYKADGKRHGYVLAFWRDGEWISEDGQYSWPRIATLAQHGSGQCAGLLWRYFEAAPEHDSEIAGAKLVKVA